MVIILFRMEPNQVHVSKMSRRSNGNIDNSSVIKDGNTLRRNLTYLNVCPFIVIDFLGSGMFVSPSLVAHQFPNMFVAIIVWIMAGVCALLGALCYCELATTLKKTGSSLHICFGLLRGNTSLHYHMGKHINCRTIYKRYCFIHRWFTHL